MIYYTAVHRVMKEFPVLHVVKNQIRGAAEPAPHMTDRSFSGVNVLMIPEITHALLADHAII